MKISPAFSVPTATRSLRAGLAAVALSSLPAPAPAQEEEPAVAEPPPSRVNVLFNMEFADKYVTPRGMIVHDEGLTFQPLLLGLVNVYRGDTFISDVTLVPGVWNDFTTAPIPDSNGDGDTGWVEIDPIAGISTSFARDFKLDVTYTAFNMQVFNIPFSQHLETKLSFNDSAYLKALALHPYVIYWRELQNKAVANTDSTPKESYYFDIGVAPSYTFEKVGLKLEAPCRVLLADEEFYGTGAGSHSTLGLYELGVKGTIPINFMPQGYGHWSFHAGVKYMGFEDDNLRATQGKSETYQIYCGLTTFF